MARSNGLPKLDNIPFVGTGVLGSAVGMDKDVMKRLLRNAGIPIAQFLVAHRYSPTEISFDDGQAQLGGKRPANQLCNCWVNCMVRRGYRIGSRIRDDEIPQAESDEHRGNSVAKCKGTITNLNKPNWHDDCKGIDTAANKRLRKSQ